MSNIPMSTPPPVLPNRGTAKVKSVLSGDTVVLLGRAGEGKKAPEVTFTFERVTAPRFVWNCWLFRVYAMASFFAMFSIVSSNIN